MKRQPKDRLVALCRFLAAVENAALRGQQLYRRGLDMLPRGGKTPDDSSLDGPPAEAGAAPVAPAPKVRRFRILDVRNLAIAGLGGALALMLLLAYHAYNLPLPQGFATDGRSLSMLLKTAEGETFGSRGRFEGKPIAIAELPADLIKAIVAIEDRRFYDHGGFDLRSILRAAWSNLQAGEVREGGSTITQQLAKLMFLSPERTLERKLQEVMLAVWLEHRLSKDEILSLYFNKVYFGAGAYGVDAAARRYFGKPAKQLSLAEAAMLAGLVKAPSQLAPTRDLETARARAVLVLQAMVETGALDQARYEPALEAPASLAVLPNALPSANYFANWIEAQTRGVLGEISGDVVVRTTLNPRLQAIAERVVAERLRARGEALNVQQAALVAMRPDGSVLAMVGGQDYADSQFNRATQALRQPGSAFKLFVYLASIEQGMTPAQRFEDSPITVEGWSPGNYNGRYYGPVTAEEAFARSLNSVAVRVSERVGRREVVKTARKLGLSSKLDATPSLALGTSEVSLLELTGAYAVLPNQGFTVRPHGIAEIRESAGGVLYRHDNPAAAPLVRQRDAMQIDQMLRATVEWGTGKAARFDWPAAGKTGTSQDFRDAWFIGYTANLVVGVWVGNDDSSPTKGVTGGGLPAQIWRDFASRAYSEGGLEPPITRQRDEPPLAEAAPRREPAPVRRKTNEAERILKRLERSIRSLFD